MRIPQKYLAPTFTHLRHHCHHATIMSIFYFTNLLFSLRIKIFWDFRLLVFNHLIPYQSSCPTRLILYILILLLHTWMTWIHIFDHVHFDSDHILISIKNVLAAPKSWLWSDHSIQARAVDMTIVHNQWFWNIFL